MTLSIIIHLFLSFIASSLAWRRACSSVFTRSAVARSRFSSLGNSHRRSALSRTSCEHVNHYSLTLPSDFRLFAWKSSFSRWIKIYKKWIYLNHFQTNLFVNFGQLIEISFKESDLLFLNNRSSNIIQIFTSHLLSIKSTTILTCIKTILKQRIETRYLLPSLFSSSGHEQTTCVDCEEFVIPCSLSLPSPGIITQSMSIKCLLY